MEESTLNEEKFLNDEAEICPFCGNVYRIIWLKEGEDYNDFGFRHCPFCGPEPGIHGNASWCFAHLITAHHKKEGCLERCVPLGSIPGERHFFHCRIQKTPLTLFLR